MNWFILFLILEDLEYDFLFGGGGGSIVFIFLHSICVSIILKFSSCFITLKKKNVAHLLVAD